MSTTTRGNIKIHILFPPRVHPFSEPLIRFQHNINTAFTNCAFVMMKLKCYAPKSSIKLAPISMFEKKVLKRLRANVFFTEQLNAAELYSTKHYTGFKKRFKLL